MINRDRLIFIFINFKFQKSFFDWKNLGNKEFIINIVIFLEKRYYCMWEDLFELVNIT